MAFPCGFFNSKGLDRTYTAEDFTAYLSSIICNGILDTYGQMFRMTAASSGLKVTLGTGKAWIDGHYFVNDARYSIDLTEYQDESLPRYVAIAILLDVGQIKMWRGVVGIGLKRRPPSLTLRLIGVTSHDAEQYT